METWLYGTACLLSCLKMPSQFDGYVLFPLSSNKKGGVGGLRRGLPGWLNDKEPACQCRRHRRCGSWVLGILSLIPGSWRSSGGGNVNPVQYSCLENPMDWGVWPAIVHGVAKSQTVPNFWVGMHGGVNFKQLFRGKKKSMKKNTGRVDGKWAWTKKSPI